MKNKFNVKGKSSKQLMDLSLGEFSALTRAELSKVVSRLASTANKRLDTLSRMEVESPAYRGAAKSGGRFRAKGKSLNELRSEYMRVKGFLNAKTSTKKGFMKVEQDFMNRMGITEIDEEVRSKMWDVYNRMADSMEPFVKGSGDRQKYIYDIVEQHPYDDIEELIDRVNKELSNDYEMSEDEHYDLSQYIEIH